MEMLRYIVFIAKLFAKFEYKAKFPNKTKIKVKIRLECKITGIFIFSYILINLLELISQEKFLLSLIQVKGHLLIVLLGMFDYIH
jgi:hypothetical protein